MVLRWVCKSYATGPQLLIRMSPLSHQSHHQILILNLVWLNPVLIFFWILFEGLYLLHLSSFSFTCQIILKVLTINPYSFFSSSIYTFQYMSQYMCLSKLTSMNIYIYNSSQIMHKRSSYMHSDNGSSFDLSHNCHLLIRSKEFPVHK